MRIHSGQSNPKLASKVSKSSTLTAPSPVKSELQLSLHPKSPSISKMSATETIKSPLRSPRHGGYSHVPSSTVAIES